MLIFIPFFKGCNKSCYNVQNGFESVHLNTKAPFILIKTCMIQLMEKTGNNSYASPLNFLFWQHQQD